MATKVIWAVSDGNGGSEIRSAVCTTKRQLRRAEDTAMKQAGDFWKENISNGHNGHQGRSRATHRKSCRRQVLVR